MNTEDYPFLRFPTQGVMYSHIWVRQRINGVYACIYTHYICMYMLYGIKICIYQLI
jgi:hypothetical protein